MVKCGLCPRKCGVDRESGEVGYCGQSSKMRVARIALHPYEEPPISGKNGSGTVFFCGCSLGCVYCQNRDISRDGEKGREYTPDELAAELLRLRNEGAENINLVTATHFANNVALTLELVKGELGIPVVYNTSGYENVETLRMLDGLVDIYLPDFKYSSAETAGAYSFAPDYPEVAERALMEMYRQVGACRFSESGMLTRGMIVRHLVLPSRRKDSIAALERLSRILPVKDILLSLMSQYTPDFAMDCEYRELHRRVTRFEYDSVVSAAQQLGFEGFIQDHSSARKDYTPNF